MWHNESCRYRKGTPPHTAFTDIDAEFTQTVEKQTAKERIKQSAKTDIYLIGSESETTDNGVLCVCPYLKKCENIKVKSYIDSQKS